ncbi:MAG: hypothetical protein Tsb009_14010 [Planctomycetaceae bacterium]
MSSRTDSVLVDMMLWMVPIQNNTHVCEDSIHTAKAFCFGRIEPILGESDSCDKFACQSY